MPKIDLENLIKQLRSTQAWQHKYEIAILSDDVLQHLPVVDGRTVQLGDDAAAIRMNDGYLLLAAEAIHPPLIEDNPYLAGGLLSWPMSMMYMPWEVDHWPWLILLFLQRLKSPQK